MVAGFVLAALSLFLGLLTAIRAIVIGILVITRGRGGAGAAIITLAIALPVAAAIVLFGVLDARAYRVPSEAMLPTVELGDRVVTTRPPGGSAVTSWSSSRRPAPLPTPAASSTRSALPAPSRPTAARG